MCQCDNCYCGGIVRVVGIGPGHEAEMTEKAINAIQESDIIVGYNTYIALIKDRIADKEIVGNGMRQEVDRCQKAVDLAVEGHKVAVISSGDPGVYGMAGLVLELIQKIPEEKRPKCEIIPGLTAANTAAAALGAPLMHDYAVISLSDLMTPWEQIQKRASLAAEGDFVIAIYNPKSRGRTTYLDQIRNIVLQFRKPGTPVGIVRKAGRPGMNWTISTLEKLPEEDVDMQSTVIIGNSNSYIADGHIITPRGYKL
ncbi:precorrin-3B C(17)-methyltransferase [Dialister invisus]|nr:precorrin-3B C(17)-methyltransferase [Dialister invisus]